MKKILRGADNSLDMGYNIHNSTNEVNQMDNKYANQCIACTVTSCKHHNDKQDYCSLEKITVGIHDKRPAEYPCTDCRSFQMKSDYDMGEC